jgi:hypothetical protein
MKSLILNLLFFIVFSSGLNGQIYFQRSYGFGSINEGRDVVQTFDMGFAVTGATTPGWGGQTNFYLIKTDSIGNPQYQYSYGGNGIDQAYSLEQLPDSGFLMAGYSNSFSINNDYDGLLIRTDVAGNQLWSKSFGTSGWDFIYSMKPTIDGNYILAGNSYGSGNGFSSGYIVKTDPLGNVLWQKFIEKNEQVNLKFITAKIDGSFIACGSVSPSTSYPADGFVAFMDANGDTIRTVRVDNNGKHETINSIGFFSNGDLALVGTTIDSLNSDNEDQFIMRMDNNGNSIWFFDFPKPGKENNNDVYINNDTLISAGSTSSDGFGKSDFHVVKFDANGAYFDGHTFGGTEDDFCNRIKRTNDLSYILVGTTTSYGPGLQSVFLIRTDSLFIQNPTVTIGIEDVDFKNDFEVFPNPTTGNIRIRKENPSGECTLYLYNTLGEIVFTSPYQGLKQTFNLPLPSGIYFLELNSKNSAIRKKLILQK